MRRLALVTVIVVLAGRSAHADKQRSLAIYADAKARYQTGDYAVAIDLFKQAYAEHPSPAYLFNTALAYRQVADCPNALTYFRRFAKAKPDAEDAARSHVEELENECGDQVTDDAGDPDLGERIASAGGSDDAGPVIDPSDNAGDTGATASGGTAGATAVPSSPRGPLVVITGQVGASFFDIGDVVTPVAATVRLGAAYPLDVGPVTLELGAVAELAPMAYEDETGDSTATWTTVLANVGVVYPLGVIRVGGELGVGLLMLSSLEAGNPFTDQMAAAGSSSSFAVRLGGSAEYEVLPGLAASLSPAVAYAGAGDDFRDEISSVARLELLGGVRYRW